MKYSLMEPHFIMKSFQEMNKKEAQQHFDWYISEISNRINQLASYYDTNGGKKEELDFSPESLKLLWAWFIPLIKTTIKTREEIETEVKNAPEWLRETIEAGKEKPSTETLAIAMDIAIYFAEVFTENFKQLKWGFIGKPKSLAYVNRPVLVGFKSMEMDPRAIVYNQLLKSMRGSKDSNILFNLFEIWKNDI